MIAIASGCGPTLICLPARLVAVLIGVTAQESASATKAVRPSGVIAIASGTVPTLMGARAVRVDMLIGVTVPAPESVT